MQIAETRNEMLAVVEAARLALAATNAPARREQAIVKARRQIERIRKAFKRRIDDRALRKPGDQWFPINAREAIERKLTEAAQEALAAVDALAENTDPGVP